MGCERLHNSRSPAGLARWQTAQAKVMAVKGSWPEEGIQACSCISDSNCLSQGHRSRQSGNQSGRERIGLDLLLLCETWGWYSNELCLGTDRDMSIVPSPVGGWKEPQPC